MKIDVLTVSGSPKDITPNDIYGRGVGGAELALMSWAEIMGGRGHEINIYNNTKNIECWIKDNVTYKPDVFYNPNDERDILITFRGPHELAGQSRATKKIGWSCDQFTVGNYINWYRESDELVVISQFHKDDHRLRYGPLVDKATIIDLGVRTWEYNRWNIDFTPTDITGVFVPSASNIERIPYQFIFYPAKKIPCKT